MTRFSIKVIDTTIVALVVWPILLIEAADAQIINVPADYALIQAAINVAVDGDTVLVAEGTYHENINFRGKAIVVGSRFLLNRDPVHIEQTVIDGSTPTDPDSASVVTFVSGEDTTSVLMGLTITGGTGTYNPSQGPAGVRGGGGIVVGVGAGGKIADNRIVFNEVTHSRAYGGGITVESPEHSVLILRNVIAHNVLTVSNFGGGGGIFHYDDQAHFAAGRVIVAENVITDNAIEGGSGSKGGGLEINSTSPIIRHNLIARNRAERGGGIEYHNFKWDLPPQFVNNTVVRNIATTGGGLYNDDVEDLKPDDRPPGVHNSIVWGNEASEYPQIGPGFVVGYSDVEGGYEGTGNLDQDPLFANTTTYALTASSPCIDAGDPDVLYNDNEDFGNPGQPLDPSQGTLRGDMGAYGGNGDFLSVGISTAAEIPEHYRLGQNYPNPFNPTTTISFTLQRSTEATLMVYDVLGRLIGELASGMLTVGKYDVSFDASAIPSGVYFYQLQAEEYVETKQMVVVK